MKRGAIAAAVILVAVILGGPSIGHALTITAVTIDIPGSIYAGPYTPGWAFPVVLGTGDNLILAQITGYNLDTSECGAGGAAGCPGVTASITVTTSTGGATTFPDTADVLINGGADPGGTAHNEAHDYVLIFTNAEYQVYVGYADDAHTDACADLSGNCVPDPPAFGPGAGVFFQGNAATGGCAGTVDPCFDSGVIRIVALEQQVPAPATLMLLGAGLFSVALWRRGRRSTP